MGQRWRSREQASEMGDEDSAGDAVILLSSDDQEANEDLSLAIVAKARLREAKRNRAKDKEKCRAFFIDLSTSSADEVEVVRDGIAAGRREGVVVGTKEEVKRKRKSKPKKKAKKEVDYVLVTEQPDAPEAEKEEPAGTSDSVIEVGTEKSNNLVLRKLLRGPRYFDPGPVNWETCYNCGEEGHTAANCMEERRQKPCFVCGKFGHIGKHCMQGQDCFVCKRKGHHAKECPDKRKNNSDESISIICLRCGDLGHDMAFCRKDYASSDIKEIRCYICKQYGHLCCVDYKDNGPIEISCYNCAEFGHTGQGCAKQRCETTVMTPTLCYKCGQEGHFARGCTNKLKSVKRLGESSMPISQLKAKKDAKVSKSLPRDFGREHRKKSSYCDKSTRTMKSKGGWIVDDIGYLPRKIQRTKAWASPTTPSDMTNRFQPASSVSRYSGYSSFSSPHTPHLKYNGHLGTPISRVYTGSYHHDSTGSYHHGSSGSYHHDFSVSRFGYSYGYYG
ncbi:uncharacterized protein LOC110030490 [Phalaenopsis equestris]|uniref:uncharacterized protein LOC110030490 n=1 Tax=Phalaenopsis equestris TaxID=78828 RepID=UPI0009E1F409|nr:uncharacterized protein LOC110030490 [Phalaenopsis equestris]